MLVGEIEFGREFKIKYTFRAMGNKVLIAIIAWICRIMRSDNIPAQSEDAARVQIEQGEEFNNQREIQKNSAGTVFEPFQQSGIESGKVEAEKIESVVELGEEVRTEDFSNTGNEFSAPSTTRLPDVSEQSFTKETDPFSALTSGERSEDEAVKKTPEPFCTGSGKGKKEEIEPVLEFDEELETEGSSEISDEVSPPVATGLPDVLERADEKETNPFSAFISAERSEDEAVGETPELFCTGSGKGKKEEIEPVLGAREDKGATAFDGVEDEFSAPDSIKLPYIEKQTDLMVVEKSSDSLSSEQSKDGIAQKTPRNIPARRTAYGPDVETTDKKPPSPLIQKPELVCRSEQGKWGIFLSVPVEISNILEVKHNEIPLSVKNGEYGLLSFFGSITVTYLDLDGGNKTFEIALFDSGVPLIFKLKNNWKGDGHRIGGLTKGYFIIFAPRKWTRLGNPGVGYEECIDAEFVAHHFFRGQDDSTDVTDEFEECKVSLSKSGFALHGKCVFDDSEEGNLFVGDPPELEPASGIVWARVGEERHGGWSGENFRPLDRSLGEVLNGRQGRFFVRVYNNGIKLIDSSDFRYCADLLEIRVNKELYSLDMQLVPSCEGHLPAMLQFVGVDGVSIAPKQKSDNSCVTVGKEGVIEVMPSCPESDKTLWTVSSESGLVNIEINLPRLWWKLESPDDPSEWRDKPFVMTREEFRTHAEKGAKIQLSLPSSAKTVLVGFNDALDRTFKVADGLPFEPFIDYPEIYNALQVRAELRIQSGNDVLTLICIDPDLSLHPSDPPTAQVNRANGGLRRGKGFSLSELRGAGFTVADTKRFGVRIDKRRNSTHQINIDILIEVRGSA